MALSDCAKCWDTPCTCGYEYRNDSTDYRIKQASIILGIPEDTLKALLGPHIPDQHPRYGEE